MCLDFFSNFAFNNSKDTNLKTQAYMEIRNLENIDFDSIFHGFEKAFADYEISFEKEEVRTMLKRRGFNPRLSFAAFDGDEIVAFTLNGTGSFNGIPTAYDTGTGTVKEYRGHGIAGKIFAHSLPFLKEAGIRQYVLEVLQNNLGAISVYRRLGFETTREFDCLRQTISQIANRSINTECTVREVDADVILQSSGYCDLLPSWQNSFESIARGCSGLTCLGAFVGDTMTGYCVFDRHSGDITSIAVMPAYRRRGIASRLLQEAVKMMKTDFIKVLNIDTCDHQLHAFLQNMNIPVVSKQYEMTLQIS